MSTFLSWLRNGSFSPDGEVILRDTDGTIRHFKLDSISYEPVDEGIRATGTISPELAEILKLRRDMDRWANEFWMAGSYGPVIDEKVHNELLGLTDDTPTDPSDDIVDET